MTVRLIEWEKPYTAGDGIDISTDKVISVLLREENNLIHLNSNNELYTDLQIVAWAKPTDDFEVWVTTWRVLESDGRPKTWTLLHYETTSGDYCQWLYGTDTNLYFDWGDGNRRQVYYADQVNEIFIRWMDFYFNTPTGNNITVWLSTDYTPTGDFTINAPTTIKDGQTYILRVNNWDTAYTMTLGTNIDNMQGTDLSLTPNATDMFVFLAVWWKLELQKEMPQSKKIFYIDYDYTQADRVWAEMEERLNTTWQPAEFKDACVVETDNTRLVYHRIDDYWENNNEYTISFATRTRIENNSADGTSRTKMYVIRFIFSYSNNIWTYLRFDNEELYTTEKYIRADYDYATPYTPLYNGSPATKKYVDDSVSVVSGDTGTKYTIKVSHSDPSWVANNVITFVTPLLEYSELIALNNAIAIINELNSDALWYLNKYRSESHIFVDEDPELTRPDFFCLADNWIAFTIDWSRIMMEDWTTEWYVEG